MHYCVIANRCFHSIQNTNLFLQAVSITRLLFSTHEITAMITAIIAIITKDNNDNDNVSNEHVMTMIMTKEIIIIWDNHSN